MKLFLPSKATILYCLHHACGLVDALPITDGGKPLQNVSPELFSELEELSKLVDIAYCVGMTGVWPPFECMSRCKAFTGYELVTVSAIFYQCSPSRRFSGSLAPRQMLISFPQTWNTGPLLSDSCGYIVLDHGDNNSFKEKQESDEKEKTRGRIIVAFRGTYSISSTIADLTTMPQEYVPYPGNPNSETTSSSEPTNWIGLLMHPWRSYEQFMSYDPQHSGEIACVDNADGEASRMAMQEIDFQA